MSDKSHTKRVTVSFTETQFNRIKKEAEAVGADSPAVFIRSATIQYTLANEDYRRKSAQEYIAHQVLSKPLNRVYTAQEKEEME